MSSIKMSALLNNEEFWSTLSGSSNESRPIRKWIRLIFVSLGILALSGLLIGLFVQVSNLHDGINQLKKELELVKAKNLEADLEWKVIELEAMLNSSTLIPRNCFEYGVQKSGFYTIDPMQTDGQGSKFKVYCNNETKSSAIYHDKRNQVPVEVPHNGRNNFNLEFKINLTYESTMEHIQELMEVSHTCYQEVYFDCHLSKINGFAGFNDRFGRFHQYFSNNRETVCECHDSQSCHKVVQSDNNPCHCDLGDTVNRSDVIRLKDKRLLPMTSFSYGPIHQDAQHASVKIGPLICEGSGPFPLIGDSCLSLRKLGQPTGMYAFSSRNRNRIYPVQECNMTLIHFEAKLLIEKPYKIEEGESMDITFDRILINDIEKAKFVPPKSGSYLHSTEIQSEYFHQNGLGIREYVNGKMMINGDNVHLKRNEALKFSFQCFRYHDNTEDFSPNVCLLKCSAEKPCEYVFYID